MTVVPIDVANIVGIIRYAERVALALSYPGSGLDFYLGPLLLLGLFFCLPLAWIQLDVCVQNDVEGDHERVSPVVVLILALVFAFV